MKKFINWLIVMLIVLLFTFPFLSYFSTFGSYFLKTQDGWANFGTAMSGIYTPILAILTVIILGGQLRLQARMNRDQQDQTYISQTLNDLNTYLGLLEKELEFNIDDRKTVRDELQSIFNYLDNESVSKDQIKHLALTFHYKHRKIFDYWLAIYTTLSGLGVPQKYPYKHNFEGSKYRMVSILSMRTCIALDQFHSCVSERPIIEKYYFWD